MDKQGEIVKRFGEQKTRTTSRSYSSSGAAIAGSQAGQRINIPAGRPVGQNSQGKLSA